MDPLLLVVLFVIIIGFAFLAHLINKRQSSNESMELIKMLQNTSSEDRKVLLQSLQSNTQSLNQRLDMAAKVISDVQRNLGEMNEIGRNMRELQEFLKSPKLRGNMGEQILKELLSQMLPSQSFHLQYAFRSGEKVDAAIKTTAGIIPIDSKFPMENFRKMMADSSSPDGVRAAKDFERDVKKHIDDIARKYILTDEGTIDYALMYIPSEAVYYEIVNNATLYDFAADKRVLPVSPTTFYAYMRAILMSFEGQKIEAKAKEVLSSIKGIQKDYQKVEENISVLQKHMTNAFNMLASVMTSFGQLGQKISNTKNLSGEMKQEVKELESPLSK